MSGKYNGISTKSIVDGSYFDVEEEEEEEEYDEEQKLYLKDENRQIKQEKVDLLTLQKKSEEKYYVKQKRTPKKKVTKKLNFDESPTLQKIEIIQNIFEKEQKKEIPNSIDFEYSVEEHFYLNYERLKYSIYLVDINQAFYDKKKEMSDKRKEKRDWTPVDDKDVVEGGKRIPKFIEKKASVHPCKRAFYASTVIGSKIWIHGGYDGKNTLSDLLCYDINTNEWRRFDILKMIVPPATQRHQMIPNPQNDELLVFCSDKKKQNLVPYRLRDLSNFETIRWVSIYEKRWEGDDITVRSDYSITSFGPTAIFFGGRNSSYTMDEMYLLEFVNNNNLKITKKEQKKDQVWPCERHGHCAVNYYGNLLIFGGQRNTQAGFLNDMWIYDLGKGLWKEIQCEGIPMIPSSYHSCGTAGNHLIIYGGLTKDGIIDCGYKFDLKNNKWSLIKPMGVNQQGLSQYELQIPLYGANSSLIGQKLIIIGGTIKDRVLNHILAINDLYDLGKPYLLSEHLSKFQKEKELCDISFEVFNEKGESKIIQAHKAVIGVRSPSLLEYTKITNCNFDVFSAYIDYLYCGKVKLNDKNNIAFLPEFSEFLGDHHTEILKKICSRDAFIDICQEIMEDMENDFEELIDSETYSDITLKVEDEDINIPSHKLILYRSPYFKSMFTSGMLESQTNSIDFQNMDKNAVLEVLNFLYTDRIEVTNENCVGVLVYSLMFGVTEISDYCRAIVGQNLTIQNVVEMLEIADIYNDVSLRRICLNFIKTNYEDVKVNDEFDNLDEKLKQLAFELHQKEQKKERRKLMFQLKKKEVKKEVKKK